MNTNLILKGKPLLDNIKKILSCPICKQTVEIKKTTVGCQNCSIMYSIQNEVPIMISDFDEKDEMGVTFRKNEKFIHILKKLYKAITFSHTYKTKKSRRKIVQLVNDCNNGDIIINIGSGDTRYSENIINLDIENNNEVDIVGDSSQLPILNNSVDLIISQAMLEHVPNTTLNISEMERILNKGGKIYCEVPFIQTYHAHPHDYYRFTISGLEEIFKKFTVIEKGVVVGPSSAFSLVLRIYLSILFSFGSKKLFHIISVLANWITFPFKFIDFLLERSPLAYYLASGVYILVEKKL